MLTHGGRLPAETSRFFGRSEEAVAIRDELSVSRLITLTGPGGVGKTRLALRVADGLTDEFPDGIRLVQLSAAGDANGLAHAVTAALDLPGEVVFRVLPLDVADDGGDAVALFADRAGAAVPGFAMTEDARRKAVWLCRALDGIPLEIEIAALRLRAVGLNELLNRLPGQLRQLAGSRRAADRQQTVQASITWSYDLCTPTERMLWTRLSVFSGGFSLAAVETVCAGGDLAVGDVLWALVGLVDKSVVLRADVAGGDARYRLLEVVREQGAAHADAADAAECAARHRDYYLGVARRFATAFIGPDQARLTSRLAQDAANLRLAFEWSLIARQAEEASCRGEAE